MLRPLVFLVTLAVRILRAMFRSREELMIENLALRQQVAALKKERPRPVRDDVDRAFWVALRESWPGWASRLTIVSPDTVAKWHRDRYRRHWAKISHVPHRPGRPRVDPEIRHLIRTVARDGQSAPRIHGKLLKLGCVVSEITVSRYMPRRLVEPDQYKRWIAFLRHHKEAIAAMDFSTVPTVTLRLLYGFFVIEHGRRSLLHFNATSHPSTAWVIQQIRKAFPHDTAPKYLIFDRDSIFSADVVRFVKAIGTEPRRIAYRSPWQNPVAERWIGRCRRELLEHVAILSDRHLIRLVRTYLDYYRHHRFHLGLEKDPPTGRPIPSKPCSPAKVVSLPRVDGKIIGSKVRTYRCGFVNGRCNDSEHPDQPSGSCQSTQISTTTSTAAAT